MRSRLFWQIYLSGAVLIIASAGVLTVNAVGALRDLSSRVNGTGTALYQSQSDLVLSACVVTGLVLLGYWGCVELLLRSLRRPIGRLTDAASALRESVEAGGDKKELRVREGGEYAKLALVFDEMVQVVRARLALLSKERNQVLAILGSMVEGVIAVDAEQKVVHINQAAISILGTSLEHCQGKPVWEAVRISAVTDAAEKVMKESIEVTSETFMTTPTGSERIIEVHAAPLRDAQGASAGAVVVLFDLTELRRLESVRRDFVANVSHELKTPLAAIRGLVETLLDDGTMPAHMRTRFLEKTKSQTNRLTSIVADLLTLSRVESQQDQLERNPVDLRRIVLDIARLMQADAEGKKLELETEIAGDQRIDVLGDDEALRQVVGNLVINAIKYTPEHGSIYVRLEARDGYALLEVQDTGIGIEQKHLRRIFERFYRVDKARSRDIGGTGLGLSIVKHVAQSLDGSVNVTSQLGKGSTFSVKLPLAPADAFREEPMLDETLS